VAQGQHVHISRQGLNQLNLFRAYLQLKTKGTPTRSEHVGFTA